MDLVILESEKVYCKIHNNNVVLLTKWCPHCHKIPYMELTDFCGQLNNAKRCTLIFAFKKFFRHRVTYINKRWPILKCMHDTIKERCIIIAVKCLHTCFAAICVRVSVKLHIDYEYNMASENHDEHIDVLAYVCAYRSNMIIYVIWHLRIYTKALTKSSTM